MARSRRSGRIYRLRPESSSISALPLTPPGYHAYEAIIANGRDSEPEADVRADDPWTLMYTSGTTGDPKGAIRSHGAGALLSLVTAVELGFGRTDAALLVDADVPREFALLRIDTSPIAVALAPSISRKSFDPEHFLRTPCERWGDLHLAGADPLRHDARPARGGARQLRTRQGHETHDLIRPGAPGHQTRDHGDISATRGSSSFTARPRPAGSRCSIPTSSSPSSARSAANASAAAPIKLLDESGHEVPDGEVGELYSQTPYTFDGYWKLPDEDARSLPRRPIARSATWRRRDPDGYIHPRRPQEQHDHLAGGENIYPSEVEAVIGAHPAVKDAAVDRRPRRRNGASGCTGRRAA